MNLGCKEFFLFATFSTQRACIEDRVIDPNEQEFFYQLFTVDFQLSSLKCQKKKRTKLKLSNFVAFLLFIIFYIYHYKHLNIYIFLLFLRIYIVLKFFILLLRVKN